MHTKLGAVVFCHRVVVANIVENIVLGMDIMNARRFHLVLKQLTSAGESTCELPFYPLRRKVCRGKTCHAGSEK